MLINVGKLVLGPKPQDVYATGDTTTVKTVNRTAGHRPAAIVDAEVRRYVRERWVRMSGHG
jgi:hypothetical protein